MSTEIDSELKHHLLKPSVVLHLTQLLENRHGSPLESSLDIIGKFVLDFVKCVRVYATSELELYFDSRYAFCSGDCNMRFVGL